MPQISFFLGTMIRMFYRDHNPIFSCGLCRHEALMDSNKLELLSAYLPPRVLGLVYRMGSVAPKRIK